METKNENFGIFENKCFEVLKPIDLFQIKGGTEDQGGTDTQIDGEFD